MGVMTMGVSQVACHTDMHAVQIVIFCCLNQVLSVCLYLQGSCGYGKLDKSKYPYWSVGALSTSNHFYQEGPVKGCG